MNNTTIIISLTNNVSSILLSLPSIINICLGIFIMILGNLSFIGNLIVFQSRIFRNQAYMIYLFGETISDLFVINFMLLTRILDKGFRYPVYSRYDFLCRIREAATYYFHAISVTFFTFTTIDRILSAQRSNFYRKWSNRVSLAYKLVILTPIFWFGFLSYRFFLYSVINGRCTCLFSMYSVVDTYLEIFLIEICPLITVFVLVYLLKRSLRHVLERHVLIVTTAEKQTNIIKRTQLQQMDSQITIMLMLQSIVAIISFLPYGFEILYSYITKNSNKTSLRIAIENIISDTTHTFTYTFFATTFHILMISSSGFRREFKRKFQMNTVHSIDIELPEIPKIHIPPKNL